MRSLETLKRYKPGRAQLIGGAIILSSGILAWAAVPNTFTAGSTISAVQVNANFTDADGRITTLETNPSISGNLTLVPSTAAAGNIIQNGSRFLHSYGFDNTFLGVNAGNFTMSVGNVMFQDGTGNVAIGANSLTSNQTGYGNTAGGAGALRNNTTGFGNTADGMQALFFKTTGNNNVAIGSQAGYNLNTGSDNIAIGYRAGFNMTAAASSNIYIGNEGGAESSTIRIGNPSAQIRAYIAGIRSVTTGFADAITVVVDSNGQLGTISSSRKVKDDIADMGDASSTLMKLRPVTFHYKSDQNPKGRILQYGLIAEEVAEVAPGLVAHSANGEIETVYYQHLAPMLLNEYQKQQRVIQAQAVELNKQSAVLSKQAEQVSVLEKQAQEIAALKQDLTRMAAMVARLGQSEKVTSVSH